MACDKNHIYRVGGANDFGSYPDNGDWNNYADPNWSCTCNTHNGKTFYKTPFNGKMKAVSYNLPWASIGDIIYDDNNASIHGWTALKNAVNSEISRRNFGNINDASYKPYSALGIPSISTVFNNTISAQAGTGDSNDEFNDMVDGLNASITAVNGATMLDMPGPYHKNPVPSMSSTAVTESNGNIITASEFNKLIDGINKAGQKCLCNCNYCTCNCNYCTCNCNYCACNCNYCTCDCNYCCTCNCNY